MRLRLEKKGLQERRDTARAELTAKDKEYQRIRLADGVQLRGLHDQEKKTGAELCGARAELAAKDTEIESLRSWASDVEKANLLVENEKREVEGELEAQRETLECMVRADNARMTKVPPGAGSAGSKPVG